MGVWVFESGHGGYKLKRLLGLRCRGSARIGSIWVLFLSGTLLMRPAGCSPDHRRGMRTSVDRKSKIAGSFVALLCAR